jgi:hypothetical protein
MSRSFGGTYHLHLHNHRCENLKSYIYVNCLESRLKKQTHFMADITFRAFNWLTPWSRTLLSFLIRTKIAKNPKTHSSVHKSPTLNPLLSQLNLVKMIRPRYFEIYFNIILTPKPKSSHWSPTDFQEKFLYALLISRISLLDLRLLDFITLMIFDDDQKLWTLHYAVLSSLLLLPDSYTQTVLKRAESMAFG